jgi:hypothetical protein
MSEKNKQFTNVLNEIDKTHAAEIATYGDTFAETFKEHGSAALLMKFNEGTSMIRNVFNAGNKGYPTLRSLMIEMAILLITGVVEMDNGASAPADKPKKSKKDKASDDAPPAAPIDPTDATSLAGLSKSKLVALAKSIGVKGAKKKEPKALIEAILGITKNAAPAAPAEPAKTPKNGDGKKSDKKDKKAAEGKADESKA